MSKIIQSNESCDHDIFRVYADPVHVNPDDTKILKELGFLPDDLNCFYSTYYGSN